MYDATLTLSYFPAQGGIEPEPITIGEMLCRSAAIAPERYALKELGYYGAVGRTWTYAELLADARRLARALASRHDEGTRVAGYANNVAEWVLFELACGFAGVTLVTVNPAYQKRELKYVLEQSRSEALYYVTEFRGNPMQGIADAVCDEIPAIRKPTPTSFAFATSRDSRTCSRPPRSVWASRPAKPKMSAMGRRQT